jgi:hypothetical protein
MQSLGARTRFVVAGSQFRGDAQSQLQEGSARKHAAAEKLTIGEDVADDWADSEPEPEAEPSSTWVDAAREGRSLR